MPGNPPHLVGHEQYYYLKEFEPQELERIADKYAISGTTGEQYVRYMSSIIHLTLGGSDIQTSSCKAAHDISRLPDDAEFIRPSAFILGGLIERFSASSPAGSRADA